MVTIILPVSRPDYLKEVFESLNNLECNKEETSLLVYVDGDIRLFEKARNLTVASQFGQRLCVHRKKGQASVGSIHRRRQRISDIHNEIKTLLVTKETFSKDLVFITEDDTLLPTNTLRRLMEVYREKEMTVGFVSGMELGRWGYVHIGAWRVDNPHSPNVITSIPSEGSRNIEQIDAAGFYCCLIPIPTYMDHHFEPFEEILGPDVQFGIDLRSTGFENFVVRDIKCKHLDKGKIVDFDQPIIQVEFTRMSNVNFGWEMKVLP